MEELSLKQKRVFDTILSYYQEHGYPPTIRELAKKLSIVSLNCIRVHLKTLQRKGYLTVDARSSRGIRIVNAQKSFLFEDIIELPIVGRIIAGPPQEAVEEVLDTILFPKGLFPKNIVGRPQDCFLLQVHGLSMEPELHEGDLVIVQKSKTANPGDMVVALINGEATVKLYYPNNDGPNNDKIILKAVNPDFPVIEVSEASSELVICGKVLGLFRKY